MNSEKVKRKLALFYHPLFQNIVQQFVTAFQAPQNNVDLLIFTEINLRIQKVILNELDINDSLSSALTDWVREIETLSQSGPRSPSTTNKAEREQEIVKQIKLLLEKTPFTRSLPDQAYLDFFGQQGARLDPAIVLDKLSVDGFAKFLFDLCYSWCEDLDIELFSFFLLALLYQTTYFFAPNQLRTKSFEETGAFIESILTQLKQIKARYQRYQKMDLVSYDGFYEWNYLPNRLREIKAKVLDSFQAFPKDKGLISAHIESMYKTCVFQIMQKELSKPTTTHFLVFPKESADTKGANSSVDIDSFTDSPFMLQGIGSKTTTHAKTQPKMKKIVMPGESEQQAVAKEQGGDTIRVHSVKAIETFIEEGEDSPVVMTKKGLVAKESKLYPIWENEISEANSLCTTQIFDNMGSTKVTNNPKDEEKPFEKIVKPASGEPKKKEDKILKLNLLYRGSTPKGRLRQPEELILKNPPNFFQKIPAGYEGRTSVSPTLFASKRRPMKLSPDKDFKSQDDISVDNKLSAFLSERATARTLTPNHHRTHRKMILNNVNLLNEVNIELDKEKEVKKETSIRIIKYFGTASENILKPNSAHRSKHRGRIYNRDQSAEENKQQLDKSSRLNLTNKSNFGGFENENDTTVKSVKGIHHIDFQSVPLEEARKVGKSEKPRKKEKYVHPIFTKNLKANTSARVTPVREEISSFRESRNSGLNESPLLFLDVDRSYNDHYGNLVNKINNESYGPIKLDHPKSVGTKPGFVSIRQALNDFMVGKDSKDLFDKMKNKVERNKKTQEIRMKKILKPAAENNNKRGLGILQVLPGVERKKMESQLQQDLFKRSYDHVM